MPEAAPTGQLDDVRRNHLRALSARLTHAPGRWSVAVVDAADGAPLFAHPSDVMLPTASSAKVLVLLAAAVAIEDGATSPATILGRDSVDPVADSGLWQHLRADALALDDVAQLIGSVSDNLATNVLIAHLGGIDQIARVAEALGIQGVQLHDIVRDERMPQHPPTLSTGSSADYADLFARLWRRELGGAAVSERVLGWLAHGTDLSMVAAAFGLDPLAHAAPDRGLRLWHKTGTDDGVRADSGVVERDGRAIAYSCIAAFDDSDRVAVLEVMRAFGDGIRSAI